MIAQIFALLEKFGYQHPVHPPLTHIVIGTTVAAFLLDGWARLTGRTSFLD